MPRVKPPSSMNDRRMSELLQAGIPLCLPDGLKPDSNPFLQSITDESIEPMSIGTLKSEWMKRELERVEEEFLERRECLVMAGSWNVNGTLQPGPIEAWLTSKSVPDIVFIGLQEVDTSTQAYIYDGAQKEKFWNETLFLALQSSHPDTPFRLLVSRLYVGVYGALFVQEEILPYIDHVATSIAACGLMGMVGNKGAVGMRFRFHTDYFCFISSHLAAHIPAVERRNQDAWEISRRTLFNAPYVRTEAHNIIDRMMNDFRANPGPAGIWDANCIIWAGDLNYRVPLDATLVRDLLDVGLYKDLLAHDQLVKERTEGRTIWRHFNEAPIDFLPTFKYDPGTSVFDSSEKNRTPAWCDRILYRSKNPIEALEYTSVPKLVASDHKPVRGLFRTEARYIVRSRFEECHARLLAQMDKLENELIPATTLQTHMIDFGQLVYRRLVKYSTAILNVGQVICQFRAIPPNPEAFSAPCAPWIRIKPQHGILMPGESREISFFFYVDSQTGPSLNLQPDRLEDIVVIHVDGGRDHFVHLSGSFRRTPFCQPLSEACAYETSLGDDKRYRRIPETVWRLVDFIIHHGIETEGLFLVAGGQDEINLIQDALDDGQDLPMSLASEMGIWAVGETLIRYLDSLPISVIPQGHYFSVLAFADNPDESRRLLSRLPSEHRSLFEYICAFLGEYLVKRNSTVTVEDLAHVFAPVLIKSVDGHIADANSDELQKLALFLLHFLRP